MPSVAVEQQLSRVSAEDELGVREAADAPGVSPWQFVPVDSRPSHQARQIAFALEPSARLSTRSSRTNDRSIFGLRARESEHTPIVAIITV
jgi:hypothetical protein